MVVARSESYRAAQLGFVVIAALVAPATAALGFDLSARRGIADSSGLGTANPEAEESNPSHP
jgi:hypothetical protein